MIGRIITLAPEDDVNSIADRVEWANADRIALVASAGLTRELDFARLRRLGQQRGAEIALIAPSLPQRLAAREVGLVAFASVEDATRSYWIPNADVEPIARLQAPRRFAPNTLARFFPRRNIFITGLQTLVGLAALGVLIGAAVVIVPSAKVTLTANSQSVSYIVPVALSLQADKADAKALVVPARRVDVVVEGTLSTETSGKKDVSKYRAGGQVTFFNSTSAQYTVPRNTVVRTSGSSTPARFATLEDVTLAPGGQASANVEAVDEGGGGNVGPNTVNQVEGIASLAVRVINTNYMGGGGGDTVRAVTKEDYARVRKDLREKLFQEALGQMSQQPEITGEGLFIVPDTFFIAQVEDETYDRFISEAADNVTLHMRIQVAAVAVSPADLDTVARDVLADKVPEGFSLLSAHAERGEVAEEGTGLRYEYYIVARGTAGAEIDEASVRKLVRGKRVTEARQTLLNTFQLKQNPTIKVEPAWLANWLNRMPFVPMRIETTVVRN
jgi:Baseplate J-like protein